MESITIDYEIFLEGNLLPQNTYALIGTPPVFAIIRGPLGGLVLHPIEKIPNISQKSICIPKGGVEFFKKNVLPTLVKNYHVRNESTHSIVIPKIVHPRIAINISRAKHQSEPAIRVAFGVEYNGIAFPFRHDENLEANGELIITDEKKEKELKRRLEDLLSTTDSLWHTEDNQTYWCRERKLKEITDLAGTDAARFLIETTPVLQKDPEMNVCITSETPQFTYDASEPEISFAVADGEDGDWFDLNIQVRINKEEVPFHELFTALAGHKSHLLLSSGKYIPLNHERFEKLRILIQESRGLKDQTSSSIKLSRFQAGLWDELKQLGIVSDQTEAWRKTMDGLLNIEKIDNAEVPQNLRAKLRPYQREGYSWLKFLYQNQLGGVLADDMGLGKTLQAIALMTAACNQKKNNNPPFLVIAPTSVVENWDGEFERFAPHLKRTVLRRGDRSQDHHAMKRADVVVTSYYLLMRDFERMKKQAWDTIFVDEAQFVKNHQAKIYGCIRKLSARARIGLTGTPMENNLMELWSLFSIVAPGLFGDPKWFRENYQRPIEKNSDQKQLSQLKQRIRPFLIRRTKEHVEKDLPPKTEQIINLDLESRHRRLYDMQLQKERQKVLGLLKEGGMREHRFQVLASLTKMRQMSLHAGLVNEQYQKVPSAKLEELAKQVTQLRDEKHRMIIFSQFTSFLHHVRVLFDRSKIPYLYLDGSTKNRKELIERFQKDGTIPVFLLSLKAGGIGLNLTAADYCILLDPWWNPAVEKQAADRAHRIGQTNPVFVYKFIAKNTVEEKVLKLQEKKKKLFEQVLDEGGAFESMITEEDIRMIFEA